MPYEVVLIHVHDPTQKVVVAKCNHEYEAKAIQKNFRDAKWTIERRPGLDTIDHIGLKVSKVD